MLRVDENDLKVMPLPTPWGGIRYSYNGIPFTGIAYEYLENTQLYIHESSFIDGFEEGLQIKYHPNGQKSVEYYSKNGDVYNYVKKWDNEGNLIYHIEYDEYGNRTRVVKHPNTNLED